MVQESSEQLAMGAAFGIKPPKQQVPRFSFSLFFSFVKILLSEWWIVIVARQILRLGNHIMTFSYLLRCMVSCV